MNEDLGGRNISSARLACVYTVRNHCAPCPSVILLAVGLTGAFHVFSCSYHLPAAVHACTLTARVLLAALRASRLLLAALLNARVHHGLWLQFINHCSCWEGGQDLTRETEQRRLGKLPLSVAT
jgi:hypothetical protein